MNLGIGDFTNCGLMLKISRDIISTVNWNTGAIYGMWKDLYSEGETGSEGGIVLADVG